MLASELGQASLAVAPVGSPLARWIASQAPAFDAGVLDLFSNAADIVLLNICSGAQYQLFSMYPV